MKKQYEKRVLPLSKVQTYQVSPLLLIFLLIFMCLPWSGTEIFAETKAVVIEATVQEDGSVIIKDRRIVEASKGTEYYLSLGNLGPTELLDFTVYEGDKQFEYIENWDINKSLEEKREKCGVVRTDDGLELCFGLGSLGSHDFTLVYHFSNYVRNLSDGRQAIYWQFIPPNSLKGTESVYISVKNTAGFSYTEENTQMATTGYRGGERIAEHALELWTSGVVEPEDYVVLLAIFPAQTFATSAKLEYSSEELLTKLNKDNDYLAEAFTFAFELEGKNYQLPFPLADLLAEGWEFDEAQDEDKELKGLYFQNTIDLSQEVDGQKKYLGVTLGTNDAESLAYKDALVVGLEVEHNIHGGDIQTVLVLPGGIQLGDPLTKAEEIYGAVDYKEEDKGWKQGYGLVRKNSIGLEDIVAGILFTTTNKFDIRKIEIRPAPRFQVLASERADGIDAVVPPDVAARLPAAETVELGDMSLTVPLQVADLLQDGWRVFYLKGGMSLSLEGSRISEGILRGGKQRGEFAELVFCKGSTLLGTEVENFSEEEADLENCHITTLTDYRSER